MGFACFVHSPPPKKKGGREEYSARFAQPRREVDFTFTGGGLQLREVGKVAPAELDLERLRQPLHQLDVDPGQPLQAAIHQYQLPLSLLQDLLTAFRRDIHHSEQAAIYASHDDLLDYARYSANPVGRLMLHLYGVHDAVSLQQSDAICSALQLYNFWQDISVDVPRGRYYLPQDLCQAHGVDARRPAASPQPAIQALVAALLDRADDLMHTGMPLPATVSHQAGHLSGWELRLVMQGGWRIGRKTRALGGRIAMQRPRIGKADAPALLWASLRHRLT